MEEAHARLALLCARPGCRYLVHPRPELGGFCCIMCSECGEHGPRCQRVLAGPGARRADMRQAPVSGEWLAELEWEEAQGLAATEVPHRFLTAKGLPPTFQGLADMELPALSGDEEEEEGEKQAWLAANAAQADVGRTCGQGHALAAARRPEHLLLVCDACDEPIQAFFSHQCKACDFDLCDPCYEAGAGPCLQGDLGLPAVRFEPGQVYETVGDLVMRREEDLASEQVATVPEGSEVLVLEAGSGPTGRRALVNSCSGYGWISVADEGGTDLLRPRGTAVNAPGSATEWGAEAEASLRVAPEWR